jgi:hypothetical protein
MICDFRGPRVFSKRRRLLPGTTSDRTRHAFPILKIRPLLILGLILATTFGHLPVTAQDKPPANVVQEFSGSGSTTTALFKVQDRWEVRWNARQVVSVAVMAVDGTIVAGAAGVLRGSLFVPLGGSYYFKISDGTVSPAAPPATSTHGAPPVSTNAPPVTPAPTDADGAPPGTAGSPGAWHLQVVQLETTVKSDQALTVYTPYFIMPDSAITPVAIPAELPPPVLTDNQARSVATIKGDNAQGYGFLMRSPDGVFVVTHLHLLAANPNVSLFTSTGAPIKVLSLKGAVDRDLALFGIQDNHYAYLPLPAADATAIKAGEQLIVPDIAAASTPLVGRGGQVIGMSQERIDFDTSIATDNTGAPVIHVKSGNVVAIVTAEKQVDLSDQLAKAWAANPPPGSADIIPYFGLRLNGVQGWETYDPARFLAESLFIKQFHQATRCLDSYLNGKRRHLIGDGGAENGPPDKKYFLTNIKLHQASDGYRQLASGADANQRLEAARELLFDLQEFAGTDLSTLQGMRDLYAYNQTRALEEIAYRKALLKELDELSNNLARLDIIARAHL